MTLFLQPGISFYPHINPGSISTVRHIKFPYLINAQVQPSVKLRIRRYRFDQDLVKVIPTRISWSAGCLCVNVPGCEHIEKREISLCD